MSPESVSTVSAAPSPAPASPPTSRLPYPSGASGAGSSASGSAGSGSQSSSDSSSSSSSSSSSGGGASQSGAAARSGPDAHRANGAQKHHANASKHPGSPEGHSGQSGSVAGPGAHIGKDFSQTLAQSLAAPTSSAAKTVAGAAGTGEKPAAKAPHHGATKEHKSDSLSAAITMMNRSVSAAVAPGAAATHATPAKPDGAASEVAQVGDSTSHHGGQNAKQQLVQATTLLQSGSNDTRAAQDGGAASSRSAPTGATALNNVAALSAGQFAAGTHGVAQAPAATNAVLSAPVGTKAWTGQLGTQLTWMARQGMQNASLQVSPQHLGPVQVSISVHHGQASVWFGASQPETRQALNQALPELRAMFANQGLALTDSGVSRDAPRDSRRPGTQPVGAVGEVSAAEGSSGGTTVTLAGVGLVDTYA